jgi:rubrerythrin
MSKGLYKNANRAGAVSKNILGGFMKIQDVIPLFEEFEHQVSLLYAKFSDLFIDDAEASDLFSKMSGEELMHQDIVRYERRVVSESNLEFGDVKLDLTKRREALLKIEQLINSEIKPSLEEAVKWSLKMERNLAEHSNKAVMKQANPDFAKLIIRLEAGDIEHVKRLREFAERRGFQKPRRRTIQQGSTIR